MAGLTHAFTIGCPRITKKTLSTSHFGYHTRRFACPLTCKGDLLMGAEFSDISLCYLPYISSWAVKHRNPILVKMASAPPQDHVSSHFGSRRVVLGYRSSLKRWSLNLPWRKTPSRYPVTWSSVIATDRVLTRELRSLRACHWPPTHSWAYDGPRFLAREGRNGQAEELSAWFSSWQH